MKKAYPVVLTPTQSGSYSVYIPDFENYTEGQDLADAIEMARDAISILALSMEDDLKQPIPDPSSIEDIKTKENEIINFVDVDFDLYRKKWDKKVERRNISIPRWLNELAKENKINVSDVTTTALKEVLGVE